MQQMLVPRSVHETSLKHLMHYVVSIKNKGSNLKPSQARGSGKDIKFGIHG